MAGGTAWYVDLFRWLCVSERGVDMGTDDELEAVLRNAKELSDAVLAHCDDWSEGRAYAYSLRTALRTYLSCNRGQTLE